MRGFVIILGLVMLVGGTFALWQFNLVDLPFLPAREARVDAPTSSLFDLVKTGDVAAVTETLTAGASVNARDQYGQTPLMYAASAANSVAVLDALLKAGAELNAQTDTGWSALMYAAGDAKDLNLPLFLLNAGADPTLRTTEGQSAADLARSNVAMSTALYNRLEELARLPFNPDWPSGYVVPVKGATISSRANHLPGAPRAYRNGTHEGFDFYSGSVSVPIVYGTPIIAVADGTVIRADHDYVENTLEEYTAIIEAAKRSLNTPPDILDALRGRQVWLEHPGGFVSRYVHLSAIAPDVIVGQTVSQGQTVGKTGNSGTLEAAQQTQEDPHPHIELWRGEETYLGKGLEPEQIYTLATQVFGEKSLLPYTGE